VGIYHQSDGGLSVDSFGVGTFTSGLYYTQLMAVGDGTLVTTLNLLIVSRFAVAKTTTFDRIAAEVTVGAVGSTVRLGIFADTGGHRPSALVLDAGTIDGNTVAVQEITISQQLVPGLYWVGAVAQGGTPTVRSKSILDPSVGQAANTPFQRTGHQQSAVSGGLPNPMVPVESSSAVPKVLLRAA